MTVAQTQNDTDDKDDAYHTVPLSPLFGITTNTESSELASAYSARSLDPTVKVCRKKKKREGGQQLLHFSVFNSE